MKGSHAGLTQAQTHNFSPGEGTRPRKHFLAARLTLADTALSRNAHTHMYWETPINTHTTQSNPPQPSTHRSQDGFHLQTIKDTVFCVTLHERLWLRLCSWVFTGVYSLAATRHAIVCLQKYNTVSLNLPNGSSVYEVEGGGVFFSWKCFLVSFYRRSEDGEDLQYVDAGTGWGCSMTSTRLEQCKNGSCTRRKKWYKSEFLDATPDVPHWRTRIRCPLSPLYVWHDFFESISGCWGICVCTGHVPIFPILSYTINTQ